MSESKVSRQISISKYNELEGKCINCGTPHGDPHDAPDISSDSILVLYLCEECGTVWEACYRLEDVHIQWEPTIKSIMKWKDDG